MCVFFLIPPSVQGHTTNRVCDCDTNCPRFNKDTKNFATGFIAQFALEATQKGASQTQFSVVSFATAATIRTSLHGAGTVDRVEVAPATGASEVYVVGS